MRCDARVDPDAIRDLLAADLLRAERTDDGPQPRVRLLVGRLEDRAVLRRERELLQRLGLRKPCRLAAARHHELDRSVLRELLPVVGAEVEFGLRRPTCGAIALRGELLLGVLQCLLELDLLRGDGLEAGAIFADLRDEVLVGLRERRITRGVRGDLRVEALLARAERAALRHAAGAELRALARAEIGMLARMRDGDLALVHRDERERRDGCADDTRFHFTLVHVRTFDLAALHVSWGLAADLHGEARSLDLDVSRRRVHAKARSGLDTIEDVAVLLHDVVAVPLHLRAGLEDRASARADRHLETILRDGLTMRLGNARHAQGQRRGQREDPGDTRGVAPAPSPSRRARARARARARPSRSRSRSGLGLGLRSALFPSARTCASTRSAKSDGGSCGSHASRSILSSSLTASSTRSSGLRASSRAHGRGASWRCSRES